MLVIGTWHWGEKYPRHYIDRLEASVARNLKEPHAFIVFRPQSEDEHLTRIPGCLARMRAFDPEWQARHGIREGDRLVCLDLDLVVTGSLDDLFNGGEPFKILGGANASNPCFANGSVWMLQAGYRPDVWSDLTLDAVHAAPHASFPDDQSWMAHKIPSAATWQAGEASGVVGFQKPGWPKGTTDLPDWARIVAFFGWRDPSKFENLDWVREHWRT